MNIPEFLKQAYTLGYEQAFKEAAAAMAPAAPVAQAAGKSPTAVSPAKARVTATPPKSWKTQVPVDYSKAVGNSGNYR